MYMWKNESKSGKIKRVLLEKTPNKIVKNQTYKYQNDC